VNEESYCAYCRSPRHLLAAGLERDHIFPLSKGGDSHAENLCWACHKCNQHKAAKLAAVDSISGEVVPLFHPNLQRWDEHFSFSEGGAMIIGTSAIGRATVQALKMNRPEMQALRFNWQDIGWKPL